MVACYCLYRRGDEERNMEYGFACIRSFCKKSMLFTATSRERIRGLKGRWKLFVFRYTPLSQDDDWL